MLPVANDLDPRHEDIPSEVLERMAELGLFGVLIPEDEGSLGLGVLDYCLVSEEPARGWMSVGSIIARGNGTVCDSADPQRRLEPRRASAAGRRIGAIAFSEPQAGSDLANVECAAVREGDEWVVKGTERWVGHALSSDFLHLLARTRPPRGDRGPSDGLELFLVEKERGVFPEGVTAEPIDKIGYFGLTTWQLELDGLRLPADALRDTGEEEAQGYTTEYAVARYWRDARLTKIFEGTSEIQRRIIGDGLLEQAPA